MEPKNPQTNPVVKQVQDTVRDLTAAIEAEKTRGRRLAGELQADVGALDTAAKACDTMAGELEKMRATLDGRADNVRDVLAELTAGQAGGDPRRADGRKVSEA